MIVVGLAIGAAIGLVAFGKLQELLPSAPMVFPLQRLFSSALLLGILASAFYGMSTSEHHSVLVVERSSQPF